jgi:hypothetical protein
MGKRTRTETKDDLGGSRESGRQPATLEGVRIRVAGGRFLPLARIADAYAQEEHEYATI